VYYSQIIQNPDPIHETLLIKVRFFLDKSIRESFHVVLYQLPLLLSTYDPLMLVGSEYRKSQIMNLKNNKNKQEV